jgi:hypothetical protein
VAKKKGKVQPKPSVGIRGVSTYQGFTPYKPPPLPSGSYDPALDAQLGAAQRGYGDLQQDIGTADLRAGLDYGTNKALVERDRDRGFYDLRVARERATQDYDTDVAALQRAYQQLSRRQAEGARSQGVMSGGLALLSAQKRAENQAIERKAIDTNILRFAADNDLARTRLGEDATSQLGQLLTEYQRGGIDRGTQLERAGRENTQFGLDIGTQKAFQAGQAGYVPPKPGQPGGRPLNQGVNRAGVPYRDVVQGDWIVRYDQYGRKLSQRRRSSGGGGSSSRPVGVARPLLMGGV